MDLRRTFIDTITEIAEKDDRVVLIIPDVGFSYTEKFEKKFPDRFFNLGVTEQSCVLIASAMALAGLRPYVYSMINFVLFRPYEMVRNGVVKHNAPVTLLGVKGSEKYKFLGFSHNLSYDDEDADVCKTIGLPCFRPQSDEELKKVLAEQYGKPSYIRL